MSEKTIAYLNARIKILSQEASRSFNRANDGRCSPHTSQEWRQCGELALDELRMVEDALAELAQPQEVGRG